MSDDNSTPLQESAESSPERKLSPDERAAQWSPDWAAGKPPPVNKGALALLVVAIVAVFAVIAFLLVGKRDPPQTTAENPLGTTLDSNHSASSNLPAPSSKALRILREQKTASENLTTHAVELIKGNRMAEMRQLYKDRWNELATLRTNITFDRDFSAAEKENIDGALRTDQEAITEVLAKYDRLYGP